ncbi:glucosyl transferase [Pantoea sp. MBD-2R]|uniref:glucosyl transferase n=1 Tax=Pantoea sp. MBD-2R TaxID=3141540 RepID=UPI0031832878
MINTKGNIKWILIFCGIFLAIMSRRPDIILSAQPWAEDGKIWMEGIYNKGFWNTVILPQNGYYQTISILAYGIGLFFGVEHASFTANVIAISIRCFFLMFILSSRFDFIKMRYRVAAALYFLLMPNLVEGYVNITNAHWYLSMYLMAIVMTDDAKTKAWKAHDYALIILSGLSGPFIAFIAPGLLIKRLYQRKGILNTLKGINTFDVLFTLCFLIQVAAIIHSSGADRSSAPLGATFPLLADIISFRVVGGSFFTNDLISSLREKTAINIVVFLILSSLIIYNFIRSDWRFKAACLLPILMIGFALAKPMMSPTEPQWPVFLMGGAGERYFFVTNFSLFCFILFMLSKVDKYSKIILPLLAVIVLPVLISSFKIKPLDEVGYMKDIEKFKTIPDGQEMEIQINPPGWAMNLIKK